MLYKGSLTKIKIKEENNSGHRGAYVLFINLYTGSIRPGSEGGLWSRTSNTGIIIVFFIEVSYAWVFLPEEILFSIQTESAYYFIIYES